MPSSGYVKVADPHRRILGLTCSSHTVVKKSAVSSVVKCDIDQSTSPILLQDTPPLLDYFGFLPSSSMTTRPSRKPPSSLLSATKASVAHTRSQCRQERNETAHSRGLGTSEGTSTTTLDAAATDTPQPTPNVAMNAHADTPDSKECPVILGVPTDVNTPAGNEGSAKESLSGPTAPVFRPPVFPLVLGMSS